MALILNDTQYAGDVAQYFILPATFGLDTVVKGCVYVKDGIVKKHTIDRVDFTTPLQARKATPTSSDSGTITVDGRTITPQDVMVYAEFNPILFADAWQGVEQMKEHPTLLARELPVTAESYITQIALARAFEQIELGIWNGSVDYTAVEGSAGNGQIKYFDGFLKKMVNDAVVKKVASPLPLVSTASVAQTSTNILEAMNSLISLATSNNRALFADPNRFKKLKFLVSIEDEQIYQAASINLTFKGQITQSGETQPWKGYQVVSLAGLPKDTIIFTIATDDFESNLWLGMNSVLDENLMLARLLPNSELFFLKGLMKFDVQYGYSEKVFMYTTKVAGDFTV
jgi:hypothetical protein